MNNKEQHNNPAVLGLLVAGYMMAAEHNSVAVEMPAQMSLLQITTSHQTKE